MRTLTSLLAGALLCSSLSAQYCIVRQHNGQSHFYFHGISDAHEKLTMALNAASVGDTLHLPGATYNLSSDLDISKRVVIIGTGIAPDSTAVTGRTILNGSHVRITSAADGSEFHGLTFASATATLQFADGNTTPAQVDGVRIIRCDIARLYLTYNAGNSSLASNTHIEGCVIRGRVNIAGASQTTIRNSVIREGLRYGNAGTLVENCIFPASEFEHTGNGNLGVLYQNNICLSHTTGNYPVDEHSIFRNNLWVLYAGGAIQWGAGVIEHTDNQEAVMGAVFQPQTPLPSFLQFDWGYNYHLIPGSPWETMATNGNQVGIYGYQNDPLNAWKDGALPFNPHWVGLDAPGGATTNGVLQGVQIRGTAQTH